MKGRDGRHKSGAEIIVVALCLLLLCLFVSAKEGFHMDELLSFELANAEYNPWIVPTQPEGRLARFVHNEIDGDNFRETFGNFIAVAEDVIRNRGDSRLLTYKAEVYPEPVWITGKQFTDYITVGDRDAFNYLSVYFNVKDDNHPPLHFMLLHTVSSVFRGMAQPWMGCVVNLAAAAVTLVLLIRLGRMLAEGMGLGRYARQTGLMCALLYGMSAGAVSTVLLIRMYAVLSMWCVALLYMAVKKWRDASFDRDNRGLAAVTVLGFWTQYFFLLYCIWLAAAVAALLLKSKRFREFWCFLRTMAAAAAIGLVLFPFAVSDVFSSGRGVEALENLSHGLGGYGERLAAFAGILWEKAVSPWIWVTSALCVLGCLIVRRIRKKKGEALAEGAGGTADEAKGAAGANGAGGGSAYVWLLSLPMAGYFLLAARLSPYLVDRYIMPLFPLAAIAGALLLVSALSLFKSLFPAVGTLPEGRQGGQGSAGVSRLACAVCALAVLLQAGRVARYDGEYLYAGYRAQESVAAAHEGEACICIYEGVGYYENLKEFAHYGKSLLLKPEELKGRQDTESIEELGQFVLLIKGSVQADEVLKFFGERYGFVPAEQALSADSVHGDVIYVMRKDA